MARTSGGLGFLGTLRRLGGAIGLVRSFRGLSRGQRRILVVVAIAALAGFLWLATGAWEWAGLVLAIALLVLLSWLAIGWIVRRIARARGRDWDAAEDADRDARLEEGERNWRRIRQQLLERGIDRIREPLFMLIGEPGAGKTTSLRRAGLEFPLGDDPMRGFGGTRMVDCFQTEEAAILDTAGRYSVSGVGLADDGGDISAADRIEWESFLDNLRQFRPQAPINGVIVVLPASSLLEDDAETRAAKAHSVLRALNDLRERLEIRFPVTVMISKADRIGGFSEFFEESGDADFDKQLLGVGPPVEREWNAPFDAEAFRHEFGSLVSRLRSRRLRLAVGPSAAEPRGRLFSFPEEFAAIASPLLEVLGVLFPRSEMAPPHFFRGVFFTSSMRREASLFAACSQRMPWPVEAPPPDREDLHTRFAHDFYKQKVFREAGLLKATVARELWALLVNRLGAGAVAMLLLAGLAWVGWSGWKDIEESGNLATAVDAAVEFKSDQTSAKTLNRLAEEIESLREPRGLSRPLDLIGRGARGDLADSLERLWRRRAFGDLLIVNGELVERLGDASRHFETIDKRERWRKAMRGIAWLSLDQPRAPSQEELEAMIALSDLGDREDEDGRLLKSRLVATADQADLGTGTRVLGVSVIDGDTITNLQTAIGDWQVDKVFPMTSVESSWPWVAADDSGDPAMQAWEWVRYLRLVESGPEVGVDFCTWVDGVGKPSAPRDRAIPEANNDREIVAANNTKRESVAALTSLGWPDRESKPALVNTVDTRLAELAESRRDASWKRDTKVANPAAWLPKVDDTEIVSLQALCRGDWKSGLAKLEKLPDGVKTSRLFPQAIDSWVYGNLKERETGTSGGEQADPFTDMNLPDVLAVVARVHGVTGVDPERLSKLDRAAATFVRKRKEAVTALSERYGEATDEVNELEADGDLVGALKKVWQSPEPDGQTQLLDLMSPESVLLPVPIPDIAEDKASQTYKALEELEGLLGGDGGKGPSGEWETLKPVIEAVIEAVESGTWSKGLWRTEPNANGSGSATTGSSDSASAIIDKLFLGNGDPDYNSNSLAGRMVAFRSALRGWFVKREAELFGEASIAVAKELPNAFPFVEAGTGKGSEDLDLETTLPSITELLAWHERASDAVCRTRESSEEACWLKKLDGEVSDFITALEKWQPWLENKRSVNSVKVQLDFPSDKVIEIVRDRDASLVSGQVTNRRGTWSKTFVDGENWTFAGLRQVKPRPDDNGGTPGSWLKVGERDLFFTGPFALLELAAAVNGKNGKDVTWPDPPGGTVSVTITVKDTAGKDPPIDRLPFKSLLNDSKSKDSNGSRR